MGDMNQFEGLYGFLSDDSGFSLLNSSDLELAKFFNSNQNNRSTFDDDAFRRSLVWLNIYFTPVIITIGLAGNMLSVLVFSCTHLRRQSSSLYLSSLALADIGYLGALFFIWMERVGINIFTREGWCQSVIYVTKVCGFLAIWNVVSFTSERYIIVYNPLRKDMLCTRKKAKIVIFSLLGFSALVYTYIFWLYDVLRIGSKAACSHVPHHYDVITIMSTIDTLFACVIPSFIIIVLNVRIIVKIHHYQQRWKEIYRSPPASGVAQNVQPAKVFKRKHNCPVSVHKGSNECDVASRAEDQNNSMMLCDARAQLVTSCSDRQERHMTSSYDRYDRYVTASADRRSCSGTSSSGRHVHSMTSSSDKHGRSVTSFNDKPERSASFYTDKHGHSIASFSDKLDRPGRTCMIKNDSNDRPMPLLDIQDHQKRLSGSHSRPVLHASVSTAGSMHIKFTPNEPNNDTTSMAVTSLLGGTRINRHKTARLLKVQNQFRTARMLLILSSVFVLLNLPSYVLQILSFLHHFLGYSAQQSKQQGKWQELFHLVYFVNFAINFFIYSACGRQFRTGLMRLGRRWKYSIDKFAQVVRHCRRRAM